MSDGIGSDFDAKLSGEDFLTLNGKAHKLDLTVLREDPTDLMSIKHLQSVDRSLFSAKCDLIYAPRYKQESLVYAILSAISQRATYGQFTGRCIVDGEEILINSWGFFEHVHFRFWINN